MACAPCSAHCSSPASASARLLAPASSSSSAWLPKTKPARRPCFRLSSPAAPAPLPRSAYTYAYATLGELFAGIIGWDFLLEYGIGAASVAHGWSHYFVDFLH